MESGPSPHRRWLAAEHADQDELADLAFAEMFTKLPPIEPSAAFTARTVQAAWQARVHRRRVTVVGRVAAALSAVAGLVIVVYASVPPMIGGAARAAVLLSQTVVWLLERVDEPLKWWSIVERAAAGLSHVVATPPAAAALVAVEAVGAIAFFALQWLVRQERHAYGVWRGEA
jgi:hypothetical protein